MDERCAEDDAIAILMLFIFFSQLHSRSQVVHHTDADPRERTPRSAVLRSFEHQDARARPGVPNVSRRGRPVVPDAGRADSIVESILDLSGGGDRS